MTTANEANEPVPAYGVPPAGVTADVRGSFAAIQRAAHRARQLAQQTGTDLIVMRAGEVVRVSPEEQKSS